MVEPRAVDAQATKRARARNRVSEADTCDSDTTWIYNQADSDVEDLNERIESKDIRLAIFESD